jgi:hypothetical protein
MKVWFLQSVAEDELAAAVHLHNAISASCYLYRSTLPTLGSLFVKARRPSSRSHALEIHRTSLTNWCASIKRRHRSLLLTVCSRQLPQPPVLIIRPRRQFVERGTTAKFRVSFEGHPQPTVAWQRRGIELRQCDKYAVSATVSNCQLIVCVSDDKTV